MTNPVISFEKRREVLRRRRRLKWFSLVSVSVLIISIIFLYLGNRWVINSTIDHLYNDVETIPYNNVGLVLGTNKWVTKGVKNQYFIQRIDAAAKLYHAGKVQHLIVSGDNRSSDYNEPRDMYQALLALGIPSSAITLDYAGFRTLDSVVRCKLVFGQTACTIISQEYHNYRCIFIAQYYGMKAVAFNALEVSESKERNHFREIFARVRAILDIYIFKTSPKYLGKKVPIQLGS